MVVRPLYKSSGNNNCCNELCRYRMNNIYNYLERNYSLKKVDFVGEIIKTRQKIKILIFSLASTTNPVYCYRKSKLLYRTG